ncbi:MAG: alpha/beta hydrolase [Rhodoferax sp.]|nr:alpha/beta hydrolase [Rhodoferax sp.]MCF8210457.1 alpha/beta hydrolase [Rhodoferax sp.]
MNPRTHRHIFQGTAGTIEVLEDLPVLPAGSKSHGVAVICHPHPLFGGTMDNKVVQTMARAFVQCGWRSVRFNFRGVGATQGLHDEGRGELLDLLAVIDQVTHSPGLEVPVPLALAGFSFGSFVISQAVSALGTARAPQTLVLVGTAASRFDVAPIPHALHEHTLVLHGELDDTVPLSDVLQWARPQSLPVTVIPGGGHFFHGQLPLLRGLVVRHLHANSFLIP